MFIKGAIKHFIDFHKGAVNIILHIIGFAGIFYSIYKLDWLLFVVSFVVVEIGHIYNHFAGIKKYDFRFKVILWRLLIFLTVIAAFYFITKIGGKV
jgi:ABC-type multidrug transport system permease subunit